MLNNLHSTLVCSQALPGRTRHSSRACLTRMLNAGNYKVRGGAEDLKRNRGRERGLRGRGRVRGLTGRGETCTICSAL